MRSRKPGLAPTVEVRDSGRLLVVVLAAIEGREALAVVGFGVGRVVVEGLRVTLASSPCSLAAEAAVGAMRREFKVTGRVGDLAFGFLSAGGEVAAVSLWLSIRDVTCPSNTVRTLAWP